MLFYNKDLFDSGRRRLPDGGLDLGGRAAPPLRRSPTLGDDVYGHFQPVQFWEFYKALAQSGGSFFGADGKADVQRRAGRRGSDVADGKPGKIMPTLADIGGTPDFDTALFKSGKLAMWHNGIWQFTGLEGRDVDYDIVVEPGNTQKANAVFMNAVVASADDRAPRRGREVDRPS